MVSYEYIQFLNEKIIDYLPQPYTVVGDKINFRCPLCGDSKKSLTKKRGWWYRSSASFYCWNCGTGMSGIKFLKILSGFDYDTIHQEYVKLFLKSGLDSSLSSYVAVPDKEPSLFDIKPILDPRLKKPLSSNAKSYLSGRRILEAPFLKDNLFSTYSKDGKKEYILIPWRLNGIDAYYQLNDFMKYNASMKYLFPKNSKKLIYGLDNIDPTYKKIFVFEGVYDSLFVKNGIATGTKSLTDYQRSLIAERWPYHKICMSFDNDAPGFASTMKLIEQETMDSFFVWFDGSTREKDINEWILSSGRIDAFTDPAALDKMILDPLQMKLWMTCNGKWKKEAPVKKVQTKKLKLIDKLADIMREKLK